MTFRCFVNAKHPIFGAQPERQIKQVNIQDNLFFVHKQHGEAEAGIVANFGKDAASYDFPFEGGVYGKVFDSADYASAGSGLTLPRSPRQTAE